MPDLSLIKKFRLHTVKHALILFPPSGFIEKLGSFPEGLEISQIPGENHDFVLLFVANEQEFSERIRQALAALGYDSLFWLAYPKKSAVIAVDLSRDRVWKLMIPTGLRPVTQIALDETWSALRFRPIELVVTKDR
jgi:hypothetical protein